MLKNLTMRRFEEDQEGRFSENRGISPEVRIRHRARNASDGGWISAEENKELVRGLIEEGVNGQNLRVFDELITPSFVDHEAEGSEPGGPEGEKELLTSVRESFPTGDGT